MYHLAWEVDTLDELAASPTCCRKAGALVGATDHSATKSLYGHDPDGLEFEVAWIVPAALLTQEMLDGAPALKPLDLPKEIARYGGSTRGGVGVSVRWTRPGAGAACSLVAPAAGAPLSGLRWSASRAGSASSPLDTTRCMRPSSSASRSAWPRLLSRCVSAAQGWPRWGSRRPPRLRCRPDSDRCSS